MMNPAISRCCTCGAEWLTGEDGSHSCAVHLNRQLAKAREERDDALHKLSRCMHVIALIREALDATK
jgi:hypothetical protein